MELNFVSESVRTSIINLDNIRQQLKEVKTKSDLQTHAKEIIEEHIKTCIADLIILSDNVNEINQAESDQDLEEIMNVISGPSWDPEELEDIN